MTDSAGYRDIDGTATWIVERGEGEETILLLHGGLGSSDELLDSVAPHLAGRYRLVAFDRKGHGRTADDGEPFHYATMAEETRAVIAALGLGPVHAVGWSDGGIIALLLAISHPGLLRRAVLIGANFHFSGFNSAAFGADSAFFTQSQQHFSEQSPGGAEQFASVASRVMKMWATEPVMTASDLARAQVPLLVMAADRDAITLAHSFALFEGLPHAQLAIIPGASHDLPQEKPDLVARLIGEFLG